MRSTAAPVVVLATTVGKELGTALAKQGLGYLDLAGNCHVELDGGNLTVHVEGRRNAARPSGTGSLRAAGYRVLFSLLADPRLLGLTVRDIGAAARASRHAVHSLIARLRDEGVLVRAGRSKHVYAPGGREKCIDRFCTGWADVLRGSLLAGRFRMREQDPPAIVQRIEQGLHAAKVRFGFGGAHGSSRWLHYLQGGEPVLHVEGWTPLLARELGALPDRQGPLHVFRTMTTLDLASGAADTAHPLLIHAELARSPDPRAREAARLLLDRIATEVG
ncbi:MAG TPA: type IV toxin-antitoxin system AbiEi family antitoxin [Planctomycetota bacterium]|nr:type IV toxin-antitoxin system AbiEi family antitoxin [Planctomycetota bacterium]